MVVPSIIVDVVEEEVGDIWEVLLDPVVHLIDAFNGLLVDDAWLPRKLVIQDLDDGILLLFKSRKDSVVDELVAETRWS